jgi:hypothetical protein
MQDSAGTHFEKWIHGGFKILQLHHLAWLAGGDDVRLAGRESAAGHGMAFQLV